MYAKKVSIQVTLPDEGHKLVLIDLFHLGKFKQGMKGKCHVMANRPVAAGAVLQTLS